MADVKPDPKKAFKIYFDRSKTSIDGVLTLQDHLGNKIIDRIHVRSGAEGYQNKEWVREHSPIPYGVYWLTLASNNKGKKAGDAGIGEAYPISSNGDGMNIWGDKPNEHRSEIMLHEENKKRGSAGCVVVVNANDWANIQKELATIAKKGYTLIRFEVT